MTDKKACFSALAAAHAENGDFDQAIEWQNKAIENINVPHDNEEQQSRLQLYQSKKPFRQTSIVNNL